MADTSTQFQEVYASFESSFKDKTIIPKDLEFIWLRKAVARFSVELDPITMDMDNECFTKCLSPYVIDTLAAFMKQFYQEREVSRVDKLSSIVTKDISINGKGGLQTAAKAELDYVNSESERMISNQLPTAYV